VTKLARVFLDTAVVQHSIRSYQEFRGPNLVDIDPTARVPPGRLKTEIDLISEVAQLARAGDIELIWHFETWWEFAGIDLLPGGGTSELLDAGVTMVVKGPIQYSRPLTPLSLLSSDTCRSLMIDFLKRITHPRFQQLQRACGAFQGDHVNENQLVDAFHIWCAEAADASHFLTTDFKLAKNVRSYKTAPPRVKVVKPSELLDELR
jgi:hypothetical protein